MSSEQQLKKLQKELLKLNDLLQKEMLEKWNRSLPFNEVLSNRWERASKLNFGKNTSIYDSSLVFGDVQVGHDTWIGPFTILDGTGGLEVGSFCSISAGVQIYTHDNVKWTVTGGKESYKYDSVKIGDRCYIGPNSIIAKGVTIGDGCIVGANSLVLKDVPAGCKAYGSPAKIISS